MNEEVNLLKTSLILALISITLCVGTVGADNEWIQPGTPSIMPPTDLSISTPVIGFNYAAFEQSPAVAFNHDLFSNQPLSNGGQADSFPVFTGFFSPVFFGPDPIANPGAYPAARSGGARGYIHCFV